MYTCNSIDLNIFILQMFNYIDNLVGFKNLI